MAPNEIYTNEAEDNQAETNAFFTSRFTNILNEIRKPPNAHQIKELDFIVGYNQSDTTTGWNGMTNAVMLYYNEADEKFFSQDHAISLVPGLNPTITFLNSATRLLGKPYTNCNNQQNYSQLTCQTHQFMKQIMETCDCYPRYSTNWEPEIL